MLQRCLFWLALRLDVQHPRDLGCWLRRLILRPRPRAQIAPDIRQIPDPSAWLAMRLDMRNRRSPAEWLLRIFFVSAQQRQARRTPLAALCGAVLAALLKVVSLLLGCVVFAYRLLGFVIAKSGGALRPFLPVVNYPRLELGLDRLASAQILSHPLLRGIAFAGIVAVFAIVVTTPFTLWGQGLFLLTMWVVAMLVRRIPGNMPTLLLIGLSVLASVRYCWWRATATLELDSAWELLLGSGLLLAEMYTWLVLLLGYIQTAWPLKRKAAPLPLDTSCLPTVDIFIPTYNEPLSVVKPTVLAAKGIDWPSDKIRIFILDDGKRPAFRQFAEEAGVEYLIRPNNHHAKAGNLNHALSKTDGEYVAIFDCDHLPTSAFLQQSMGWFLRDPKCAMLQTPHHFFSPDPFERNLSTFRRVPNEGALFYGLIQDANDLWNATFFCGSCAIIKRAPLLEVGGIAVETVTEDAHTALKLHRLGYTTAYINVPLAAGLATESLSGHVGQRIRWARGMAQIFRIDNPLLGKGLSIFQRICYGNAMLHFFYGIPRLVFLTAPLAYLYFEMHLINAAAGTIALYVLPHILQANLANAHIQGTHRHSFWAEVYETVLAWYITLPTTVAMIKPSAGTFNVTAKGGLIEKTYFDWSISKPYIALIAINLVGLLLGPLRLLFWNSYEPGTIALNMIWTFYNLLMLGVAVGVATETRQVRAAHRVNSRLPAALQRADGSVFACHTQDYSMSGLGLEIGANCAVALDEKVSVSLWRDEREYSFPAQVIAAKAGSIGIQFDALSLTQEAELVQCTFARAEAWTGWKDEQDHDHPMQGLKEIFHLGVIGYKKLFRIVVDGVKTKNSTVAALFAGRANQ